MLKDKTKVKNNTPRTRGESYDLDDDTDLENMDIGVSTKRRRPPPTTPGRPQSTGDKFCSAMYLIWWIMFSMKGVLQGLAIIIVTAVSQFSFTESQVSGNAQNSVTYSVFVGITMLAVFKLLDLVNSRCSRRENSRTYEMEFTYSHPLTFLNFFFVLLVLVVSIYFSVVIKSTCTDGSQTEEDCILNKIK